MAGFPHSSVQHVRAPSVLSLYLSPPPLSFSVLVFLVQTFRRVGLMGLLLHEYGLIR